MRRAAKFAVVATAVVVAGSAGTVMAYGNWRVSSQPVTVKVRAVAMPAGVRPSVARNGGAAVVTWARQEIGPGSAMQSYVVRRHNVDTGLVTTFAPTAGTTYQDGTVPAGRWCWTITPKFAGWVGAESRKSENLTFTLPGPVAVPGTVKFPPPEDSEVPPAGGPPVVEAGSPTSTPTSTPVPSSDGPGPPPASGPPPPPPSAPDTHSDPADQGGEAPPPTFG